MLLNTLRTRLASPRASYQMCLLAIIAGCSAAAVIVIFRLAFEYLQLLWLNSPGQFHELLWYERLVLPVAAVAIILLFARLTGLKYYRMGVPFVIHRVKRHYGNIPFPTFLNQFFGGAIALASGFGVGKEGPSVHLGAASSGFIGHFLKLPLNSIRILAGCGISAGIAACFNTPFAAVIFVMEVVLREYKVHIFIPVMLAAACGSLITKLVFGEGHALDFLSFTTLNPWVYWYLIPCGMVLGVVASLFNRQLIHTMKAFGKLSMTKRLFIAGVSTGVIGSLLPHAMGASLEAIAPFIENSTDIDIIALLLVAKMVMTILAIALGIPGGIIGPVFGFGMLAGLILLYPLNTLTPGLVDNSDNFALLGMAGMLASVLHAPLSALSAVMELSMTPEVIMPAMLVIVPAYITSVQLMKNRSIFLQQLDHQKLPYTQSSLRETLQRHGVLSALDKNFSVMTTDNSHTQIQALAGSHSHTQLIPTHQTDIPYYWLHHEGQPFQAYEQSLLGYPLRGLSHQATLAEAYELLENTRKGAVYVYNKTPNDIIGIVKWSTIRSYLTQERY